ncbi:WD40 repeat-like protein [Aureobasidium namibiae CBS 147.97]|uniref:WD40 repeat-like protein n=1 Tax=Aureobasidium namibiae CBS 147.97 TaxID=1043004 RepID=A0A074WVF8_9PEZI
MRSARLEAKFGAKSEPDHVHTPRLPSPPGTTTPPTAPHARANVNNNDNTSTYKNETSTTSRKTSEAIDPDALSKALQQFEEAGRNREHTPGESPKRKRQRVYTDRFIPNRAGQDLHASYNLLHDQASPATPHRAIKKPPANELHGQKTDEANRTYSSILRSEMFNDEIPQSIPQNDKSLTPPANFNLTPSTPHKNLFSYKSAHPTPSLTPRSHSRTERGPNINARSDIYSLSPVKYSSQSMLLSPRKTPRAVSKVPYKVLDAPELADDFYLNLVDWGSSGVLAVGLGDSVYLWNSESGKVEQLCKLTADTVTSVGWIQRGSHLAVGTGRGHVLIFDTVTQRRLRTMIGHSARVSSLAWNAHILSTGSRDRTILHRDVRSPQQYLTKLVGHKQEVCGLRWNSDTNQLASGGNDNKIFIWDGLGDRWLHRWGEQEGGHKAAVKAIAWSPHQRGLLASGGGTADRCIKFWNTISTAQHSANAALTSANSTHAHLDLTSASLSALPHHAYPDPMASSPQNPHLLRTHDTGSQVCNLLFSTLTSELVSTHGFSQHAINIWKYPSMSQVVSLTGHTYRVLYLSMSPDGSVIVTGAGDETLRFWDAFGGVGKANRNENSVTGKGSLVKEWNVIR